MGRFIAAGAVVALLLVGAGSSEAKTREAPAAAIIAARGCSALMARVDAVDGDGPLFLRSYDGEDGQSPPAEPVHAMEADIYDNALAAIALSACGQDHAARRIATAIAMAVAVDRLYNVYRAGAQTDSPPPNGWYDKKLGRWVEDDYQVGTATGNVAWAGLALLTIYSHGGERRYLEGAQNLGHWVITRILNGRDTDGFAAGFQRVNGKDVALTQVSTEHNADLAAMFDWLRRKSGPERWRVPYERAFRFVASQWEGTHFAMGLLPDGHTENGASALDCQTLPLLLADARPAWSAALTTLERTHGVDGGLDFNDDKDGVWLEGTAQAALALRVVGKRAMADKYLALIAKQFSPGGYVWATTVPQLTTGLAIGPNSVKDDFTYRRWPHLGATAWAVLAATGWNPYTGERVP